MKIEVGRVNRDGTLTTRLGMLRELAMEALLRDGPISHAVLRERVSDRLEAEHDHRHYTGVTFRFASGEEIGDAIDLLCLRREVREARPLHRGPVLLQLKEAK